MTSVRRRTGRTTGQYRISELATGRTRPVSVRALLDGLEEDLPEFARVHEAPLTLFAQNMALLVAPAQYRGESRDTAISALVRNLKRERPDVVGLSEVFKDAERARIRRDVRDIYPHYVEGPDEDDHESDGGLLLLSKSPIKTFHQTVFRDAAGWDAMANKGAVHARIAVANHPTEYDVFLAHLQNPDESGGWEAIEAQLRHLSYFIRNYRDHRRPAYLLGDLNVDALKPDQYATLKHHLDFDEDLWAVSSQPGETGVTIDDKRAFVVRNSSPLDDAWEDTTPDPDRAADDPARHQTGDRVDYVLLWRSTRFWPVTETDVVVWQSRPDRDLSDHYGLMTSQSRVRETAPETGSIDSVTVRLRGFHCLYETGGVADVASRAVESDEIELEMGVAGIRNGRRFGTQRRTAPEVDDVDTGESRGYGSDTPTVEFGDPGDELYLLIKGVEVDTFSDDSIGGHERNIDRQTLLRHRGKSFEVVFPLREAGGEFAVIVEVTVA